LDPQTVINILAGTVLAGFGWFGRQVWEAVADLRRDMREIERDLPHHYVRREEFTEGIREIKEICAKIFDKIDSLEQRKVDR